MLVAVAPPHWDGKTNSTHSSSTWSNFTTLTYRMTQLPCCSQQTPVIPVNEGLWPSRPTIAVYKFRHTKDTHSHTHKAAICHILWKRAASAHCCPPCVSSRLAADPREAELHLSMQECGVTPSGAGGWGGRCYEHGSCGAAQHENCDRLFWGKSLPSRREKLKIPPYAPL